MSSLRGRPRPTVTVSMMLLGLLRTLAWIPTLSALPILSHAPDPAWTWDTDSDYGNQTGEWKKKHALKVDVEETNCVENCKAKSDVVGAQ